MFFRRTLLVSVFCSLVGAPVVWAGTFQVDSTTDSPSINPGDGKCVSKAGGCTLRSAVQEANASTLASTIQVPPGTYTLSIAPEGANFARSGGLMLDGEITISGDDFTRTIVDGGGVDRVFDVSRGSTVQISGLTVQNGAAKGSDGGGLRNRGNLTMHDMFFSKNQATGDPGVANGRGGAIYNEARMNLMNVTIDSNQADGRGGGVYNGTSGQAQIMNGRISSNRSLTDNGGGVLNAGNLSMSLLPIRRNHASNGGGIDNVEGELKLFDVLLGDNVAGSNGGGLRNSGNASLKNVTVGANQAGVSGGGIDNRAKGQVNLNNVTVAQNQAGTESQGQGGGVHGDAQGSVSFANTLIAANTVGGQPSDCAGVLTSKGYNLVSSRAGCTLTGEATGNLLDKPAGLEALASNGGPAPSFALSESSLAVDAGNPASPSGTWSTCLGADQRGVRRPQAGKPGAKPRCDIGAYERKL